MYVEIVEWMEERSLYVMVAGGFQEVLLLYARLVDEGRSSESVEERQVVLPFVSLPQAICHPTRALDSNGPT
jgi:hypothetical protein